MAVGHRHHTWMKQGMRRFIARRDGPNCHWCGAKTVEPGKDCQPNRDEPPVGFRWRTLDHVIPVSEGGKFVDHNLVIACDLCNQKRAREQDPLHGVPRP